MGSSSPSGSDAHIPGASICRWRSQRYNDGECSRYFDCPGHRVERAMSDDGDHMSSGHDGVRNNRGAGGDAVGDQSATGDHGRSRPSLPGAPGQEPLQPMISGVTAGGNRERVDGDISDGARDVNGSTSADARIPPLAEPRTRSVSGPVPLISLIDDDDNEPTPTRGAISGGTRNAGAASTRELPIAPPPPPPPPPPPQPVTSTARTATPARRTLIASDPTPRSDGVP